MKSILYITKTAVLGTVLLAAPGFAQSTDTGTDRPYGTADRSVGDATNSAGNWGWVGLLGLIGLMGLRRPNEYRARTDVDPMGSRT
jgi:MYXO-CTERM domain-containing protein